MIPCVEVMERIIPTLAVLNVLELSVSVKANVPAKVIMKYFSAFFRVLNRIGG